MKVKRDRAVEDEELERFGSKTKPSNSRKANYLHL